MGTVDPAKEVDDRAASLLLQQCLNPFLEQRDVDNEHAAELAQMLRVEFQEARQVIQSNAFTGTIGILGAWCTPSSEEAEAEQQAARSSYMTKLLESENDDPAWLEFELRGAQRLTRLAEYYECARVLSQRLTKWAKERRDVPVGKKPRANYIVSTDGGKGISEAANRGAQETYKGRSLAFVLSDDTPNQYVTPDLTLSFSHESARRFWFFRHCKALVAFPGDFAVLRDLLDALTASITGQDDGGWGALKLKVAIVLFGKKFWGTTMSLTSMSAFGGVSGREASAVLVTDSVDEAFAHITHHLP